MVYGVCFGVLLSPSVSRQAWEDPDFKGQQLSPHTSRKKQTCKLNFSFEMLLPFSLRA